MKRVCDLPPDASESLPKKPRLIEEEEVVAVGSSGLSLSDPVVDSNYAAVTLRDILSVIVSYFDQEDTIDFCTLVTLSSVCRAYRIWTLSMITKMPGFTYQLDIVPQLCNLQSWTKPAHCDIPSIPYWPSWFPKLRELVCCFHELTLPPEFGHVLSRLPLLTSLSLYDCRWESDFTPLLGLKHLVTFRFDRLTHLNDFMTVLIQLTSLTELSVDYNSRMSHFPKHWEEISRFPNLMKLTLWDGNHGLSPLLSTTTGLKKLTHLCLPHYSGVNVFIGKFTTLRYLVISDSSTRDITKLTNLETLLMDVGQICRDPGHNWHTTIETSDILKLPKLKRLGMGYFPSLDEVRTAPVLDELLLLVSDHWLLRSETMRSMEEMFRQVRPGLKCRSVEGPWLPYLITYRHDSEYTKDAWATWEA
jgi:hypothetical protein